MLMFPGVSQSEAELNGLRTTVASLRDATANLGRSNMGGSSDLTKNLTGQLRAAEAQLKTFQVQLISTYSSVNTFSIRAIAAMRGQLTQSKVLRENYLISTEFLAPAAAEIFEPLRFRMP